MALTDTAGTGKTLFQLVFLFWIVMDSFGALPIFVSFLKHFEPSKQYRIIFRELLISLTLMILFLFFGQGFLSLLNISHASLEIAGGTILFLIAIKMIFAKPGERRENKIPRDPLIVPLAVPSIAGPGILATITLYGGGIGNKISVLIAIIIAWALSLVVLLLSPFLNTRLGENGVVAIERLFGYLVVLISTQMAFKGLVDALS